MFMSGSFRNILAKVCLTLAAAVLVFGAWAYFELSSQIMFEAASGAVGEPEHLAQMLILQKAFFSIMVVTLACLAYGLYLVWAADARLLRTKEELIRQFRNFERNDWHDDAAAFAGDELEEIVMATNALARRMTGGRPGGSNAPAAETEDIKSKFLEIISHQLRTPLTAVRWNLEALLNNEMGALNKRQEDLIRITDKNYQGILVMISDWIEALEVERGMLKLNPEPIDLADFFATIEHEFKNQAKLKRLKFAIRLAKDTPRVLADKLKLRYIFGKLLHNAMGYTREEGAVTVKAAQSGRAVKFEITDTGVGIPYEDQANIFKKFFRASNASLMQPNASGVGMFVTKTLIEHQGGEIDFASEEGVGTTFTFTLPATAGSMKK
jgi:signal transduction histidine kinase